MTDIAAPPRARIAALDAIRFAAVGAVVVRHAVMVSAIAGLTGSLAVLGATAWALPLLFATSGFLSTYGGHAVDLRHRMRRLLVPYFVWSAVLLAYEAQGALRAGTLALLLRQRSIVGIVLAGEAYYTMWFLAALVYASLVGYALRTPRARLVGAGLGFAIYTTIAVVRAGEPVLGTDTWRGFLVIAPLSIATYLLGALLPDLPRPRHAALPVALAVGALVADAALYVAWGTEITQPESFAILALGSVTALLSLWTLDLSAKSRRLVDLAAAAGIYTLGIYVMHAPLLNIVRRLTHTRTATSLAWALVVAVIAIATSLAVSWAMARVRALRPLVR